MKQKIIKFLKDKFNIALIVIQMLALISYVLGNYFLFFLILFFIHESVFFIVWGIKLIFINKNAKYQNEIYQQLPYTEVQRVAIQKNSEKDRKNNKTMAVMLILLGTVLFFSGISVIF